MCDALLVGEPSRLVNASFSPYVHLSASHTQLEFTYKSTGSRPSLQCRMATSSLPRGHAVHMCHTQAHLGLFEGRLLVDLPRVIVAGAEVVLCHETFLHSQRNNT